MQINELELIQFKNYNELKLRFSAKFNAFVGQNGVGKTNILDAMYYLSFSKSYFNSTDQLAINHQSDFFMITGQYWRNKQTEKLLCAYKRGQKKQLKRNDKPYAKFVEHIGLFPAVLITPNDISLITGTGDERRKFLDSIISQYDSKYLSALLSYNKVLQERNKFLKTSAKKNTWDQTLMDVLNTQLATSGTYIHKKRKAFTDEYLDIFQHYYQQISGNKEQVQLSYQSKLFEADFIQLLQESQEKDRILQHTSRGIHRDDLEFALGNYPIKKVGSQGQQKTYLIAIKFAQYKLINNQLKINPVLLLDDVFDKLDNQRVQQIVKLVSEDSFGQIFFTDTSLKRMNDIFEQLHTDFRIFEIANNQILHSYAKE